MSTRALRVGLIAFGSLGVLAAAVAAFETLPNPEKAGDGAAPRVLAPAPPGIDEAIFAAGCFWCVEKDFDEVPGVVETISGYTGGRTANPSYEAVARGRTGHVEAVLVRFDPKRVSYQELLDYYWRHTDVTDGYGQFCDRGSAYRPVIFTRGEEQAQLAQAGKAALEATGRFREKIAVSIRPAGPFTPAETEHQDYSRKNPIRYRYYRTGCGRDARIKALWRVTDRH